MTSIRLLRIRLALALLALTLAAFGTGSARAACGEEGSDEVAFQGSGKLLLAACGPKEQQAVLRLDSTGQLDRSFAEDGSLGPWTGNRAAHLAVTPEGKVLVQMTLGKGRNRRVVLRRFSANGKLDRSFAGGKATILKGGSAPEDIHVFAQPQGTAVVAYYGEWDGCYGNDCAERTNYLQLLRWSVTGKLIAEASYYTEDWKLRDITMAPNGDLLVAGGSSEYGKATYLRTKPNLKPRAKHNFREGPFDLGVARVLAGPGESFFGSSGFGPAQHYLSDWSIDEAFGEAGAATCGTKEASVSPRASLPSGGFLATGGDADCGLAEFGPDGRLDPAFGSGGSVNLEALGLTGPQFRLQSIAVGPNGEIAIAFADPNKPIVRISRFTPERPSPVRVWAR